MISVTELGNSFKNGSKKNSVICVLGWKKQLPGGLAHTKVCSHWFLLVIIMSGSVTIRMAVKLYSLITSVGIFFRL